MIREWESVLGDLEQEREQSRILKAKFSSQLKELESRLVEEQTSHEKLEASNKTLQKKLDHVDEEYELCRLDNMDFKKQIKALEDKLRTLEKENRARSSSLSLSSASHSNSRHSSPLKNIPPTSGRNSFSEDRYDIIGTASGTLQQWFSDGEREKLMTRVHTLEEEVKKAKETSQVYQNAFEEQVVRTRQERDTYKELLAKDSVTQGTTTASMQTLVTSLYETIGDKEAALTSMRRTSKMLALKVAEQEAMLKRLEERKASQ